MLSLRQTIASLARNRGRWEKLLRAASRARAPDAGAVPSRLQEVHGFGANPGNLRMFSHLPARLEADPALVVVLHGCTQTAAGYDHGAGWSTLADRYGFALLLPEQQPSNNPNGCFNWFQTGDIERGRGEALSIRQMVEKIVVDQGIDRRRVFITGLSAGGAMTSVMLACYPEVFAGRRDHCRPAVRRRRPTCSRRSKACFKVPRAPPRHGAISCVARRRTMGPGLASRSGTAAPTRR